MAQIRDTLTRAYIWAKNDFQEWPLRFTLEISAWFMSIGCAIAMAATLPNPPFLILYPLFITQCAIFAWAAWTRRSTGMLANYLLLVSIDSVGLARLLFFT
jgi:hypothetical protein